MKNAKNWFGFDDTRNSHHLGRIGTYGEQSIEAGKGVNAFCQCDRSFSLRSTYRGSDGRFATNPICLAMPGTNKHPPVLLDMATSRIALGRQEFP
ncbi:MAG: hypothetical protein CM1200mP30_08700 [Pseudomonadota bacterium]|nr:MAG: hypothetical protein CM1200mP30_08700 [Pseudomonadota bacterium]